jgi:hypothetical protein
VIADRAVAVVMAAADSTAIVAVTVVVAAVTAEAEDAIETVAVADAEALPATETVVAVEVTVAAVIAIVADAEAVVVVVAAAVATAVIANATVTPCWAVIPTTAIVAGADRREAEGAPPEAAETLPTVGSSVVAEAAANTNYNERAVRWVCPLSRWPYPSWSQKVTGSGPLIPLCYHRNRKLSMQANGPK